MDELERFKKITASTNPVARALKMLGDDMANNQINIDLNVDANQSTSSLKNLNVSLFLLINLHQMHDSLFHLYF